MKKVLDILDSIQEVHCTEYANEKIEEAINYIRDTINIETKNCNNCKYATKFPIYNMICQRVSQEDEFNPVFEQDIYPEFCCNKWETNH